MTNVYAPHAPDSHQPSPLSSRLFGSNPYNAQVPQTSNQLQQQFPHLQYTRPQQQPLPYLQLPQYPVQSYGQLLQPYQYLVPVVQTPLASKGVQAVLIAILALVALDIVVIRPQRQANQH